MFVSICINIKTANRLTTTETNQRGLFV